MHSEIVLFLLVLLIDLFAYFVLYISFRVCIMLLIHCKFTVTGICQPVNVATGRDHGRGSEEDIPMAPTFPVSLNIASGLKYCTWPGRNQIISEGLIHYFLDGAHTSESVRLCTDWFIHNSKAIAKK